MAQQRGSRSIRQDYCHNLCASEVGGVLGLHARNRDVILRRERSLPEVGEHTEDQESQGREGPHENFLINA